MDLTQHTENARTLDEKIAEMQAEVEALALERKEIGDSALERLLSELKDGIELFGWNAEEIVGEIAAYSGDPATGLSVMNAPAHKEPAKPVKSGGKVTFAYRKDKNLRYSGRGRLPEWMYTEMCSDGVDIDSKPDVKLWKETNLVEVAA
jgi:hypothetical protein